MEPTIHIESGKLVSTLEDFLSALPADTKSVQVVMYAYADDYETYNDKTKCVAEGDSWYVLPEDARMELIGKAVTHCLQLAAEVVSAPSETEEEYNEAEEKLGNLREALKSLARSFSLYMENVDTAALAGAQLERLFEGIIAFNNRVIYGLALETFQKRKTLRQPLDELQWKLMSGNAKPAKAKVHSVGAPVVPPATQPKMAKAVKPAEGE